MKIKEYLRIQIIEILGVVEGVLCSLGLGIFKFLRDNSNIKV